MAEEVKKTGSSKGCLIALGVVGVFLVIGIIGFTIFVNKAKNVVEGMAEGMGVSPRMLEQVERLNDEYPFQPPADNRIYEKQVNTYIDIKQSFADEVKKHEETLQQLDERIKQKDQADWGDVTRGFKILGEVRRDFLTSLKKHEMSPKEYAYLTTQIYSTYFTEAMHTNYQQRSEGMSVARQQYTEQAAEIREKLDDPNLTEQARKSLEATLENYERLLTQTESTSEQMEQEYQKMPQENIELLNRYREELEKLNTSGLELWGLGLMPGFYE